MYTQLVNYSRRDLSLLFPALAASGASATGSALPSKAFRFEDLPVKPSGPNGQNSSRALMKGQTHSGYDIEMHITELAPGLAPHAPHHHAHEEAVVLLDGTLEVTITGKSTKLTPGSVAYVASNEEHGWKNVGATRARYVVLAFGADK